MNLVHLDIKPDNIFISLPDEEATVPTECNELVFDGLKAQYKIGQSEIHCNYSGTPLRRTPLGQLKVSL